jgi:signal peptidase II
MISGGIGNIIDRIRLHYVVDYIEPTFIDFAVFNFADCLITVGAFVMMIYLIADITRDAKNSKSGVKENEFLKDETVVKDDGN